MRKVLISENQFKKLVQRVLINEDEFGSYETAVAGTNKSPIAHSDLNSKYGLPYGKYEFFNYKTTVGEIFRLSKGPENKFLSSFVPNENMGKYDDYISVGSASYSAGDPYAVDANNTNAYKSGTFVSDLISESDVIIAAHNGLLAVQRLMLELKNMQTLPKTLQVIFGKYLEKTEQDSAASAERLKGGVKVEIPTSAYDITPELRTIAQLMICYLDYSNTAPFCKKYTESKTNMYNVLINFIPQVISGYKFLPRGQQSKFVEYLSKRGFVTSLELPEIRQVLDKIILMKGKISTSDANTEIGKINNASVVKQILAQVDDLVIKIEAQVLTTYISNLTLYVKTYFQSAGTDELAKINNMKFNKVSAFDAYSLMFRKETAPTNVEQGVYSQEFTALPSVKGS
jgi:hypothetical protein